MKEKVTALFEDIFGERENIRVFFSPGRVNLIGEHTDYNGGNVFPCALSFGTYGAISIRNDKVINMYSKNFDKLGIISFNIDELKNEDKDDWANYPKGVLYTLKKHGYEIECGFDMVVYGNIPNGAGLSSSASIELLMGVMVNDVLDLGIDRIDLVKFCQEAENKFIGVNCGIMDQFAIGMGKSDSAILLDCNSLDYKYSKLELNDNVIVIGNTNKRRGLADSKYNERRNECEKALKELKAKLNINHLGDLSEEEFEENKHLISNPINKKRAKHAVYENQRTLKAVEALKNDDIHTFGKLMVESHDSLKNDYEVTGKELDTLVELALEHKATIGSRMTGAGFGGCTVSIVKKELKDCFISEVSRRYKEIIGYEADFYEAEIGNGTKELL
ncbi:galactokinase [Paraclostridium bifermentans]|uniref:galactokinase n=1 Tax=Paraclostridium bifermentans TaxID=1490 RepID=UPI001157BB22|nr:galactokinase [Paraclostridium bifermentans]TQO57513.1 galactokinase [Paraclostridium bifermentans]